MKKKRSILKWLIPVGIAGIAVAVLLGGKNKTDGDLSEETVQRRDIVSYNSFVGNVQSAGTMNVTARAGEQVTELLVEKGDHVEKGDVIAKLNTGTLERNIRLKEASLSATRKTNSFNLKEAQRIYDEYADTLDAGLNASLQSAANQVSSAQTALSNAIDTRQRAIDGMEDGTYQGVSSYYQAMKTAESTADRAEDAYDDQCDAADDARDTLEEAQEALDASDPSDPNYTNLSLARDAAEQALSTAEDLASDLYDAYCDAEDNYDDACDRYEAAKDDALASLNNQVSSAQTTYDNACAGYNTVAEQARQQLATYGANIEKIEITSSTSVAEVELSNLRKTLEDYTITAPASGTVTSLYIDEGSLVSAGMTVAAISDLTEMEISIRVDEYSIRDTTLGSPVTVYIDSIDESYEGTISWIAAAATIQSGVSFYEATVIFDGDDNVRSGMSVEVRLVKNDRRDVLSIPVDAVRYREDNSTYVLGKDENGKSVERSVTVGASDGMYIEILSGLEEGDTVLVEKTNMMYPEWVS